MSDADMIYVRYSCAPCRTDKREIPVPARMSPEEDVVEWMRRSVIEGISKDHKQRHPACWAKEIKGIMVPMPKPMDDNSWIGQPQGPTPYEERPDPLSQSGSHLKP